MPARAAIFCRARPLAAWLGLVVAMLLGAASLAAPRAQAVGPDDTLHMAEELYAKGAYAEAAKAIVPLLVDDALLSPERRGAAFLMKARLELAFARGTEWRLWLAKAHRAFPALALDPVKDPPQLIAHWHELQTSDGEHDLTASETTDAPASHGALAAAMALLPLGVGHFEVGQVKSGALFLATESLVLLASASLPSDDAATAADLARWRRARTTLSVVGLLGAYGYEVLDLLPVVAARDEGFAQTTRALLPLAPFGVGQVANGEATKGATVAALQAVALTIGVLATSTRQQRGAAYAFAGLWGYGILDAYAHLLPAAETSTTHATLTPFVTADGIGLALTSPLR